jgi:geranylgeranyl pyrophosphate synthase
LAQGTLTLPSLLILEHYPGDNPVKRLFNNEGNKQRSILEALELVRNSSIIDECYQAASDYSTKACSDLNLLPDNPSRQALLALADYVVRRRK